MRRKNCKIIIQNAVIRRVLTSTKSIQAPWILKVMQRLPILRRIPARVIGMGFRPEHVRTRDIFAGR